MYKKAIVFDLDETIGYFTQIFYIKEIIENNIGKPLNNKELFELFDLYPNIFRIGIFNVFKYLKKIKKKNNTLKIIIYTNNNGPKNWVFNIKNYIEQRIKYKLFDKIIPGFNHNNITNCRTTHKKTYEDLRKCTNLTFKDKIIFFDDRTHEHLIHDNIKYIKVKPYEYEYNFYKIKNILLKSKLLKVLNININHLNQINAMYTYKNKVYNSDNMFKELKLFLLKNKVNKTKKNNHNKNKTKRKRLKKHKTKKNKQHGGMSLETGASIGLIVSLYAALNNDSFINLPTRDDLIKWYNSLGKEPVKTFKERLNHVNKIMANVKDNINENIDKIPTMKDMEDTQQEIIKQAKLMNKNLREQVLEQMENNNKLKKNKKLLKEQFNNEFNELKNISIQIKDDKERKQFLTKSIDKLRNKYRQKTQKVKVKKDNKSKQIIDLLKQLN